MPAVADISLVFFMKGVFLLHNTLMTRFNVLMNDVLAHIGEKPLIFGSGSLKSIQNTVIPKQK